MGGFFGCCNTNTSGGGSGTLGPAIAYASPAGSIAAAPGGFTTLTGRINVTLPSGDATWVSLPAGGDGQLVSVRNTDATHTLILSAAGFAVAGLFLPPGHSGLITYDLSNAVWEVVNG